MNGAHSLGAEAGPTAAHGKCHIDGVQGRTELQPAQGQHAAALGGAVKHCSYNARASGAPSREPGPPLMLKSLLSPPCSSDGALGSCFCADQF